MDVEKLLKIFKEAMYDEMRNCTIRDGTEGTRKYIVKFVNNMALRDDYLRKIDPHGAMKEAISNLETEKKVDEEWFGNIKCLVISYVSGKILERGYAIKVEYNSVDKDGNLYYDANGSNFDQSYLETVAYTMNKWCK